MLVKMTSHLMSMCPAVSVQSYAPSDDLFNCTGHAPVVSYQSHPELGRMIAPEVLEIRSVRFFGSTDVVWATSRFGWIAASG